MGKGTPERPAYTYSVGGLIKQGVEVRAWCNTCMAPYIVVDLARIAEARGDGFSLWGKKSSCRLTEGCKGVIRFFHGGRGMMSLMGD